MCKHLSSGLLLTISGVLSAAQAADISCLDAPPKSLHQTKTPLSKFRSIVPGAPISEVRKLVGEPSCLDGFGIPYDVYVLADGRRVRIAYPHGNALWAYLDGPGERSELLFDNKTTKAR
jgi:hypothetical protein